MSDLGDLERFKGLSEGKVGEPDTRQCTCHPDDNPPVPCPRRYALTECRGEAYPSLLAEVVRLREGLAFYASEKSYESALAFAECGHRVGWEHTPVLVDDGNIARSLLSATPVEETT